MSHLLMENKTVTESRHTNTHRVKGVLKFESFVFGNKQDLPHQSPGQIFIQKNMA